MNALDRAFILHLPMIAAETLMARHSIIFKVGGVPYCVTLWERGEWTEIGRRLYECVKSQ